MVWTWSARQAEAIFRSNSVVVSGKSSHGDGDRESSVDDSGKISCDLFEGPALKTLPGLGTSSDDNRSLSVLGLGKRSSSSISDDELFGVEFGVNSSDEQREMLAEVLRESIGSKHSGKRDSYDGGGDWRSDATDVSTEYCAKRPEPRESALAWQGESGLPDTLSAKRRLSICIA